MPSAPETAVSDDTAAQRKSVAAELASFIAGKEGENCERLGTLSQVVGHLPNILSDLPHFHYFAVCAFTTIGDRDRAVEHCELALRANPNDRFSAAVHALQNRHTSLRLTREWAQSQLNSHGFVITGTVHADRKPTIGSVYGGYRAYDVGQLHNYTTELAIYRLYPTRVEPVFIYVYAALLALGEPAEFSELGGTLFAAYDKLVNCENLLGCGLRLERIRMINVEYSECLADAAQLTHMGVPIETYREWHQVPEAAAPRVSFSRGVASYAFATSEEFAKWLTHSHATVLREVFALAPDDMRSETAGKRVIYFSLPKFVKAVAASDCRLRLIAADKPEVRQPGDIQVVALYLIAERMSDDQRAQYRQQLDALDLSLVSSLYNSTKYGPLPLSSAAIDAEFDLGPFKDQIAEQSIALPVTDASFDLDLATEGIKEQLELLGRQHFSKR